MKRLTILSLASLVACLPACSSSSNGGGPGGQADASGLDSAVDAEPDGTSPDDATSGGDALPDAASSDTGAPDTGEVADSGAPADSGSSIDATCPSSWLAAPTVDVSIEVPADGGAVILHAAGAGTQNYLCEAPSDGGVTSWVLTGPSATLSDCNGDVIGHHFASDGGANYPEWQTTDGTYVVGDKIGHFTPDGGAESVPWLLLQEYSTSGSGTLSQAAYIQRLFTDGGVAPGPGCDAGDILQVPYGADYYFYGH
jgi:hypothetical protein